MNNTVTHNGFEIVPETELESRIVESLMFKSALKFASRGSGHPEKMLGVHIAQILEYVDNRHWNEFRQDLRTLTLLHDLGKPFVVYSPTGHVVGNGHQHYSEQIAREFVTDERILRMIGIHDKHFSFFKRAEVGKFNEARFLDTYRGIDLQTLTRFNYADSCNRDKTPVTWFEDVCAKLGLKTEKIYEIEKEVLE